MNISTEDQTMLVTVELSREYTNQLERGDYHHELEIQDDGDNYFTVMTGEIEVRNVLLNE